MSKILIIDDNEDMLLTLEHLLQFYEFEVLKAENGKVGVDRAVSEQPDLIIVDALMPVMNGFEACDRLKTGQSTNHIPVIFLSANYTAPEHRRKGMELGADDYMLKPFNAKELIAKVNSLLHRKQLMKILYSENVALSKDKLSQFQTLFPEGDFGSEAREKTTGLPAKEALTHLLVSVLGSNAKHQQPPLSLILADADQFMTIQSLFGDQTANYVLLKVGNLILKNAREGDLVFCTEGDRFAILQPELDESASFNTAAHILDLIRSQPIFDEDFFAIKREPQRRRYNRQELTLSAGVASWQFQSDPRVLAFNATEALEHAKKTGRNKVVRYSDLVTTV